MSWIQVHIFFNINSASFGHLDDVNNLMKLTSKCMLNEAIKLPNRCVSGCPDFSVQVGRVDVDSDRHIIQWGSLLVNLSANGEPSLEGEFSLA